MKSNAVVIGAGIGGLSCSAYLAKAGYNVTILEKNSWTGGRIRTWYAEGFTFDMGPSWYWMPEIFEEFFSDFGHKTSDFYELIRLDPSYRIYFENEVVDIGADKNKIIEYFETQEEGAGKKLQELLKKTEQVYKTTMRKFFRTAYFSQTDILNRTLIPDGINLLAQYNGFQSVDAFLRKYFKNENLIHILQFPIFFLGGSAKKIPSFYSMMNHVDLNLGTWYPLGGFQKVAKAYTEIAKMFGVKINLNTEVLKIDNHTVTTASGSFDADIIISNADYHHTEIELLDSRHRSYPEEYWESKAIAPSALLMYIGVNKKIEGLLHHTLFFHNDWENHMHSLYDAPAWPTKPLSYVSCPSKTDSSMAPANCDAITILIPVAAGLQDTVGTREEYFQFAISDIENRLGEKIRNSIQVKKISSVNDFVTDFHSYKGNAYGLAHTLNQTALFRPKNRSSKLPYLFYVGQFTNPGIGVSTVSVSGKIVAQKIIEMYEKNKN